MARNPEARPRVFPLSYTATTYYHVDTHLEAAEGNDLLLGLDVLEVAHGLGEAHALDGHGGLPRVLEVHTQVRPTRLESSA